MQFSVQFQCVSGEARLLEDEDHDMHGGDSVDVVLYNEDEEATALRTRGDRDRWMKGYVRDAKSAVGIGKARRDSGYVRVTSLDSDMVVREYREVNAFLDPDAPDHIDHVVRKGESLTAETISANKITLMPLYPAI